MLVFAYHPTTKELLSSRQVISGITPQNVVLGPCETLIIPPECAGTQKQVFINGAWSVVPDYRRVPLYRKSDQSFVRIPLGSEPDNTLTRLKPSDPKEVWDGNKWALTLEAQKEKKLAQLFIACDNKLNDVLRLYPQTEPQTWAEKIQQAEIWSQMSDDARIAAISNPMQKLAFAMLIAEAVGTIVVDTSHINHITDLAVRILKNKTAFGAYAGLVLNLKTLLSGQIRDANSIAELKAISLDFSAISLEAIVLQMTGG